MFYYFKQFITNPAYINKSMLDTLFAYYSSYVLTDDYLYLFHYLDWDEKTILDTIIGKYNWERETDTIATWRIGDGTASFYNYIYYIVSGFNENDTFRSNQIREGKIQRDQALELSTIENFPRWKSIHWYCETIGIDFDATITKIKFYPHII